MPEQFPFTPEAALKWTPDVAVYRPHLGVDIARVRDILVGLRTLLVCRICLPAMRDKPR